MNSILRTLIRFSRDERGQLPFAGAATVLLLVSGVSSVAMSNVVKTDLAGRQEQVFQDIGDLATTEINEQARQIVRIALVWSTQARLDRPIEDLGPLPPLTPETSADLEVVTALANTMLTSYIQGAFPRTVNGVTVGISNASITVQIADVLVEDMTVDTKGINWGRDLQAIERAERLAYAEIKQYHGELTRDLQAKCATLPSLIAQADAASLFAVDIAREQCATYEEVARQTLEGAIDGARFKPNVSGLTSAPGFDGPGIDAPRAGKNFYRVGGKADLIIQEAGVNRRTDRVLPIDTLVLDQSPFQMGKTESMSRAATGPYSEVGRLVSYMLGSVSQWRAMNGIGALPPSASRAIGGIDQTAVVHPGPLITEEDVHTATLIALDLSAARHFKAIPADADPRSQEIFAKYARGATLDPGDVAILMTLGAKAPSVEPSYATVDLRQYLAQALYSVSSEAVLDGMLNVGGCESEGGTPRSVSELFVYWGKVETCFRAQKNCGNVVPEFQERCRVWSNKLADGAKDSQKRVGCTLTTTTDEQAWKKHEWTTGSFGPAVKGTSHKRFVATPICYNAWGIGEPGDGRWGERNGDTGMSRSDYVNAMYWSRNCHREDGRAPNVAKSPRVYPSGLGTPTGGEACPIVHGGGNSYYPPQPAEWAIAQYMNRRLAYGDYFVGTGIRLSTLALQGDASTTRSADYCDGTNNRRVTWEYKASFATAKLPDDRFQFAGLALHEISTENAPRGEVEHDGGYLDHRPTTRSIQSDQIHTPSNYGTRLDRLPGKMWSDLHNRTVKKEYEEGVNLATATEGVFGAIAHRSRFFEAAGVDPLLKVPIDPLDTRTAHDDFKTLADEAVRKARDYYEKNPNALRDVLLATRPGDLMRELNERPHDTLGAWFASNWDDISMGNVTNPTTWTDDVEFNLEATYKRAWKAGGNAQVSHWLDRGLVSVARSESEQTLGTTCDKATPKPSPPSFDNVAFVRDGVADKIAGAISKNDEIRAKEIARFREEIRLRYDPIHKIDLNAVKTMAQGKRDNVLAFDPRSADEDFVYNAKLYDTLAEAMASALDSTELYNATIYQLFRVSDGYQSAMDLRNTVYRVPLPTGEGFQFYSARSGANDAAAPTGTPPEQPDGSFILDHVHANAAATRESAYAAYAALDTTRLVIATLGESTVKASFDEAWARLVPLAQPTYEKGDLLTIWERARDNGFASAGVTERMLNEYAPIRAQETYYRAVRPQDHLDPLTNQTYDPKTRRVVHPLGGNWSATEQVWTGSGQSNADEHDFCMENDRATRVARVVRVDNVTAETYGQAAPGGLYDPDAGRPIAKVLLPVCGQPRSALATFAVVVDPIACTAVDPVSGQSFTVNGTAFRDLPQAYSTAEYCALWNDVTAGPGRNDVSGRAQEPAGSRTVWDGRGVRVINGTTCADATLGATRQVASDAILRAARPRGGPLVDEATGWPVAEVSMPVCGTLGSVRFHVLVEPLTCTPAEPANASAGVLAPLAIDGNSSLRHVKRAGGDHRAYCDAIHGWSRTPATQEVLARIDAYRADLVAARKEEFRLSAAVQNPPGANYLRAWRDFNASLAKGTLPKVFYLAGCQSIPPKDTAKECARRQLAGWNDVLDKAMDYPLPIRPLFDVDTMFRLHADRGAEESQHPPIADVKFRVTRVGTPDIQVGAGAGKPFHAIAPRGAHYGNNSTYSSTWDITIKGTARYEVWSASNDLTYGPDPYSRTSVSDVKVAMAVPVTTVTGWPILGVHYQVLADLFPPDAKPTEEQKEKMKEFSKTMELSLGPLTDIIALASQIADAADQVANALAAVAELILELLKILLRALVYVLSKIVQVLLDIICFFFPIRHISMDLFGLRVSMDIPNCKSSDWDDPRPYGQTWLGTDAYAYTVINISMELSGVGQLSFSMLKFRDHWPVSTYLAGVLGNDAREATVPYTWVYEGTFQVPGETHPWRFAYDVAGVGRSWGIWDERPHAGTKPHVFNAQPDNPATTSEQDLRARGPPTAMWLYHRWNALPDGRFVETRFAGPVIDNPVVWLEIKKKIPVGKGVSIEPSFYLAVTPRPGEGLLQAKARVAAAEAQIMEFITEAASVLCIPAAGQQRGGVGSEKPWYRDTDQDRVNFTISVKCQNGDDLPTSPADGPRMAGEFVKRLSHNAQTRLGRDALASFAHFDAIGFLVTVEKEGKNGKGPVKGIVFDVWMNNPGDSFPKFLKWAGANVDGLAAGSMGGNALGTDFSDLRFLDSMWVGIYAYKGSSLSPRAQAIVSPRQELQIDLNMPFLMQRSDVTQQLIVGYGYRLSKDNVDVPGSRVIKAVMKPSQSEMIWLIKGQINVVAVEELEFDPLYKYAPRFVFHPEEKHFPVSVDTYLNASLGVVVPGSVRDRALSIASGDTIYRNVGEYGLRWSNLSTLSAGDRWIELPSLAFNQSAGPGTGDVVEVYGRVLKTDTRGVLTYFLLFPRSSAHRAQEGQWAAVDVILPLDEKRQFKEELTPFWIAVSGHAENTPLGMAKVPEALRKYERGERWNWTNVTLTGGSHPNVYVSMGAHALSLSPDDVVWGQGLVDDRDASGPALEPPARETKRGDVVAGRMYNLTRLPERIEAKIPSVAAEEPLEGSGVTYSECFGTVQKKMKPTLGEKYTAVKNAKSLWDKDYSQVPPANAIDPLKPPTEAEKAALEKDAKERAAKAKAQQKQKQEFEEAKEKAIQKRLQVGRNFVECGYGVHKETQRLDALRELREKEAAASKEASSPYKSAYVMPWLTYKGRWGAVVDPLDAGSASGSFGPGYLDHGLLWNAPAAWAYTLPERGPASIRPGS